MPRINPIWSKGGHYGPDNHETLWHFYIIFMFEWPHESHLWNSFFEIFEKSKKYFQQFRQQRVPPLKKKSEISTVIIFFGFLNLYCTCS